MFMDLSRITDAILEGDFPEDTLTLDEQVKVINEAAYVISMTAAQSAARREEGRCYVLWIAGLHPDLFLYGAQYLLKFKGLTFPFDDKTRVRLDSIEKRFNKTRPYEAKNYALVEHHAWPKEFLDESTFEDRLAALAEEYESEESPADMLLSGMGTPEDLDFNQRMQLAQDCVESLGEMYRKYGKSNVLIDERVDRFMGWLLTVEPDILIYSMRMMAAVQRVIFDPKDMKNWDAMKVFEPVILRV